MTNQSSGNPIIVIETSRRRDDEATLRDDTLRDVSDDDDVDGDEDEE